MMRGMSHMKVYTVPAPVLREKANPVEKVDERIQTLMKDMLETMYVTNGIGLAANQVGVLERIIVLDVSETRDGTEALLMANPEVIERSAETFTYNEGCLSVRPDAEDNSCDLYANVTRPKRVKVKYTDEKGEAQEIEGEDLLSTCLQHEIDHLDGILFIDHLSKLKRSMMLRKIEKARKLKGIA